MPYQPFKNEETRTSVLSGVRDGSEAAWSRFFDIYAGYVYSLANQAGLLGADGDEIVQTVFIELTKPGGFDGYDRNKGAFRSWLRRRVEWRIKDEFRRRGVHAIWFPHALPDKRTVSRHEIRDCISNYMIDVMHEEPLDPSLLDFDDDLTW